MKDKVVFRKFRDNGVIALFPELKEGYNNECITSYMHVGQHGDACPDLIEELERATPEEYDDLKEELLSIGYDLEVNEE